METQLIHIVESSGRHQWFEELVFEIQRTNIHQTVITLDRRGKIFQVLEKNNIFITGGKHSSTILKLCRAAYSAKKISRQADSSLAVAQGHLPSIAALISKILFNIDYGIVHHQSPIIFFDSYKMRHPFRGTIQSFLYRQYIKRAEFVQALSLEVFNSLIELEYPENRIILLGHGIALDNFNSSANIEAFRNKGNAQTATILMVGRLSWEKNYSLAFKVIAELVKKCPGLQVIIAGTGPEFSDLVEIRNELELQNHIQMVGWQPNIAELMFRTDLLLHLSLTESYGQVLLEACLCNLHVFTFPVGIALDLQRLHNPYMHILDSRNPEMISESIFEFLKKQNHGLEGKIPPSLQKHDISYIHSEMAAYLIDKCNR